MLSPLLSQKSLYSVNAIFSYLRQTNAKFVFWIRSADYERQLYISKTYEVIWNRPCENLYQAPESFLDTLFIEDVDRNVKIFDSRPNNKQTKLSLFRVTTPTGQVRWIKDYSFALYDENNKVVAIAGFGECIEEKDWDNLVEKPFENIIEKGMLDMFVSFTQNSYILKNTSHSTVNLFHVPCERAIFFDDLIVTLSERELDCLTYTMADMSAKQVARKLDISPRTVETYLSNIKVKTNSRTNLCLVGKTLALVNKIDVI